MSILTIDRFRLIYLVTFLVSFLLTEMGREIYRPFIYSNRIDGFGIADSIGNLGGIIVQIFFGLTLLNSSRKKGIRLIAFFILGYILYEIAQSFLPKGVFDWQDIYGIIIGGMLGIIFFLMIQILLKKIPFTISSKKMVSLLMYFPMIKDSYFSSIGLSLSLIIADLFVSPSQDLGLSFFSILSLCFSFREIFVLIKFERIIFSLSSRVFGLI